MFNSHVEYMYVNKNYRLRSWQNIQNQPSISILYTAISGKVVGKSARNNPERHCGWF